MGLTLCVLHVRARRGRALRESEFRFLEMQLMASAPADQKAQLNLQRTLRIRTKCCQWHIKNELLLCVWNLRGGDFNPLCGERVTCNKTASEKMSYLVTQWLIEGDTTAHTEA
jgi:hypothetical protein